MTHHHAPSSPSAPRERSAGRRRERRGRRGTVLPLIAAVAAILGGGIAVWFTVGPGGAEADTVGEPVSFRDVLPGPGATGPESDLSPYEQLAEGTELLAPGETHTFANGVELTVYDPRIFTPETPEVLESLRGTAWRLSIRQEDHSGQSLPLAPAAPDVAAGEDLAPVDRIWDSDEDVVPALDKTEGAAAFDVPPGTAFLIVEIRTPHIQSGLEYAHWRIDL